VSDQLINPFVLPATDYKRDIDVIKHYVQQSAVFLAKMTGQTYEVCVEYVRKELKPGGRFAFKDPNITYLERGDTGDREVKHGTLYSYVMGSIKEGDLIAPTFTTYLHPKKKKSLLAIYIGDGKKRRNKAKKEMFGAEMSLDAAKQKKDKDGITKYQTLYVFKKQEQTNAKQKNNSLSGAHTSASTTLYNKTAHPTLTSVCRSTSGYGNANNEKFLAGNRHYWSPMIVFNNITSIITHSDYAAIKAVIEKYNLHYPTPEEAFEVIQYSTKHYWRNERVNDMLRRYLATLLPIELAAFVYTGDLYHIRKFNPDMVRQFVMSVATRVDSEHADPAVAMKHCHEDQRNLAITMCSHVTKGIDPGKLNEHPKAYAIAAATAEHVYNTVNQYEDFIRAFFVTENVPASMAYFPESLRHVALTSDTDSTIFTAQEWVEWAFGRIGFQDEMNNLSSTMIYLASASITHVLARMSANLGIDTSMIFAIAMKNEYKFDIFVPTQVAKHYYAYISSQEGKVYSDFKEEIKGVHLKNSNVSKYVMKKAKEMMTGSMRTLLSEKYLDVRGYLKEVADIERSIIKSVENGDHDFFKYGRVNSKESYKRKEGETEEAFLSRSNYRFYGLWQEVFAPDYGEVPPPPYTCLKLSTNLDTPTKTREWLASINNRDLAQRLEDWMTKNNKKYLGQLLIPEGIIMSRGIPKELIPAIDVRGMVSDTTAVFYKIFESMGIYFPQEKRTRLACDYY
jgi:hypothetical protein